MLRLQHPDKYLELECLLYDGAVLLFDKGQVGSGVDLVKCFLDVLNKAENIQPEEKYFLKLTK